MCPTDHDCDREGSDMKSNTHKTSPPFGDDSQPLSPLLWYLLPLSGGPDRSGLPVSYRTRQILSTFLAANIPYLLFLISYPLSFIPYLLSFQKPRPTAKAVGACGFILTHNHVSGRTIPSTEDWAVTWHLQTVGEIMNLPLYDHIIVGEKGYTSLLQSRNLEPSNKETISRNIFELLNYSCLGLQTLCCDPAAGTVMIQLPDGKWVVKVDALPKDTVL